MEANLTKEVCGIENLENEIWAAVECAPKYQVSNYGRILSNVTAKPKIVSTRIRNVGGKPEAMVATVRLDDGKRVNRDVKFIVADAFLPADPHVGVKLVDGNIENCRVSNLVREGHRRYNANLPKREPIVRTPPKELEGEEWRVLKKYPNYSVSNKGRVKNNKTEKLMSLGYSGRVHIRTEDKISTNVLPSKLVYEAFVGDIYEMERIGFIDGDSGNMSPNNLYLTGNYSQALRAAKSIENTTGIVENNSKILDPSFGLSVLETMIEESLDGKWGYAPSKIILTNFSTQDLAVILADELMVIQLQKMTLSNALMKLGVRIMNHNPVSLDGNLEEKQYRKLLYWTAWLLIRPLVGHGAIELKKMKSPRRKKAKRWNQDPYMIVFSNDTFFKELFRYTAVYNKPRKTYLDLTNNAPDPFVDFYHPVMKKLVRNANPKYVEGLNDTDNPKIFNAINRHQATKYVINEPLLDVLNQCLDDDLLTQKSAGKASPTSILARSKAMLGAIQAAEEQRGRVFYEYMYYDWRLRLYSATEKLSHAGNNTSKALIKLAKGEALGREGWNNLLAYAGSFINSRGSKEEMLSVAEDNLDYWYEVASDPLKKKHKEYWQGLGRKKAFVFLATLLEIKAAIDSGDEYSFVSNIVLHTDASNSGLQFLSALAKDEEAAKYCNLVPSFERRDYYLEVGRKIWKEEAGSHPFWGKEKFNNDNVIRDLCKRSCMVIWYSCGPARMAEIIMEDHGDEELFQGITPEDCRWLADRISTTSKSLFDGPSELMKIFVSACTEAAKRREDFSWTVPYSKTKIAHHYRHRDGSVMTLHLPSGEEVSVAYHYEFNDYVDVKEAIKGAAANVVHSCDAALVSKVLNEVIGFDVITIHDSFGCIPSRATELGREIRRCFEELLAGNPLEELLESMGAPELMPKLGELTLKGKLKDNGVLVFNIDIGSESSP